MRPVGRGLRAEFLVSKGVARLEFPGTRYQPAYEDFEVWVNLVSRRAKRAINNK